MVSFRFLKTAFNSGDYYKSINEALRSDNGSYRMLHYPYYISEKDNFSQAQNNLIDYCICKLSDIEGKDILDIGCGNGIAALYIADKYPVKGLICVDINTDNIKIADEEKRRRKIENVTFIEGDAQNLIQLGSNSIDIIINIESAFHYPEKELFLEEIYRILKPRGQFIITDILTTSEGSLLLKRWKRKMKYNHWSFSRYNDAFSESKLTLKSKDDITDKVILGFEAFRNYIKELRNKGKMNDIFSKLFLIFNLRLNVCLLKKRRKYYVFYGEKQESVLR